MRLACGCVPEDQDCRCSAAVQFRKLAENASGALMGIPIGDPAASRVALVRHSALVWLGAHLSKPSLPMPGLRSDLGPSARPSSVLAPTR